MTASRHLPALLALSLLFAASAASAGNVQPRLHGPGGDGGECTAADAGSAPDAAPAAKPPTATTAKPAAAAPARIKPVVTVRGGGGDDATGSHAPRWHSFLPGMFR